MIVHPKNSTFDVTFPQLEQLLRLNRQFWKNDERVVLYQRGYESVETGILLAKVYRMNSGRRWRLE